ncbi:MAG: shikimate kinase [Anaerorhabdus sp.]
MIKGLVGFPLKHSFSYLIHPFFSSNKYQNFELDNEQFHKFMTDKNFDAINVTHPYKEQVMKYLDIIDKSAQNIGCVNTVVKKGNKLIGYNSDALGFKYLIESSNISLNDMNVYILGSGGSAKTVSSVLNEMSINWKIVSRNSFDDMISYDDLYSEAAFVNVIINATPIGMHPKDDGVIIDCSKFNNLKVVIDLIYNPINTNLLQQSKDLNIIGINGLKMLVAQAKYASEIFDDVKIKDELIETVSNKLLNDQTNYVLIGMSCVGKSTLASMLADKLKRKKISTDNEIVTFYGKSINEIFKEKGENFFRKLEAMIIEKYYQQNGLVIDCGGGIVLSENTMKKLRYNGKIIWIKRDINKIDINENDRPLVKNVEDHQRLYNERYKLYNRYADLIIENNSSIEDAIEEIISKI